jgi:hypothetical protein
MGLMTLGAVLVLSDGLTAPATAQVGSDPVALAESHLTRRLFESMVRRIVALPVASG